MAKKYLSRINSLPLTKKVITYLFLTAFGVTMLVPFFWMVSTSLKTSGEAFRPGWIPIKYFVRYDGELLEIKKMVASTSKVGLYRVKIISGPKSGDIIPVPSNELTQSVLSKKIFSIEMEDNGGKKIVYDVRIVEKVKPQYYRVEIAHPRDLQEIIRLELPEDRIIRKVSPQWKNYPHAIEISGVFGRAYINSIVVAVLVTLGQVFTSSLAAYAFARLRFPGRDALFMGYLATMMIPGAVTMIPVFIILKVMPDIFNAIFGTEFFSSALYVQFFSHGIKYYIGKPIGLDSFFALIAPGLFSAYGTFLLRQFFMGLPVDLEDAARIDGCSLFRVYTHVILPLSKPALATLSIFTLIGSWGSFMWPMVVTSSPAMQTLPVMLSSFMQVTTTQWELLMAASMMVIAPMIVVFLIGQRFFIEGIQLGAVKG